MLEDLELLGVAEEARVRDRDRAPEARPGALVAAQERGEIVDRGELPARDAAGAPVGAAAPSGGGPCGGGSAPGRSPLAADSAVGAPAPDSCPRGVAARCIRARRVPSRSLAEPPPPSLDAAIAALWRDARPRALDRVATLEAAVAALRDGALAGDAAVEATREAHKLAGALGTFGMPAGTRHARTVEQRLAAGV